VGASKLLRARGRCKCNITLGKAPCAECDQRRVGDPAERWGDKTPLNAFALEPIRAVFPRARFVHLLRDGVDVAHSYVEAGLVPDLASGARRWRASVSTIERFARAHPGQCYELRYEALVRDAPATVQSLYAFLRLDFQPRFLEAHRDTAALPDAAHAVYRRFARLDGGSEMSLGETQAYWAGKSLAYLRLEPGAFANPRLSPDGRRLAVSMLAGSESDIWVYELSRGIPTRLTFESGSKRIAVCWYDSR